MVLENMGIFGEGREQYENVEGQNYAPNKFAFASSPGYDKTLSFTKFLEKEREPIPFVERTLEAEVHEEETIREENQLETIGPLEPPAEKNPTDETLGGENQPRNDSFMKSPEDEAHLEENPKNDNCSGDTIALGSPKREIHDEK